MLNATKDITEQDLARMKYYRLLSEQAEWNARRRRNAIKVTWLKWIWCFIIGED